MSILYVFFMYQFGKGIALYEGMSKLPGTAHQRRRSWLKTGLQKAARIIRTVIIFLDRLSRSRTFRQLLTMGSPFIPLLIQVIKRHYGT
jgi:hypothetical protein